MAVKDQLYTTLGAILLCMSLLNIIFHTIGTWLLLKLYKNGKNSIQNIYVINVSICEIIMNSLVSIRAILLGTSLYEKYSVAEQISRYVYVVMCTGFSLVYYSGMMYITADRMLDILLSIRYVVYWNQNKTKKLILSTWIIGCVLSIGVSVWHHCAPYVWERAIFQYFYPAMNVGFILLAFVTYGFIFKRFSNTRTDPTIGTKNVGHVRASLTMWRTFRNSKFYISVLLILSYVLFMATPDVAYLIYGLSTDQGASSRDHVTSKRLRMGCWVSYAFSNMIDAYIYILLQHDVKKLFFRKLRKYAGFLTKYMGFLDHVETRGEEYSVNGYDTYGGLNGVVVITAITDRYFSVQRCVRMRAKRSEFDIPMCTLDKHSD